MATKIIDFNTFIKRTLLASIHGLNDLIAPLDSALFAPSSSIDPSPLFIVGAPRSGSTLCFQVLAHAFKVTYLPTALDYTYGMTHGLLRVYKKQLSRHAPVFKSHHGKTEGLLSPSEAFGFWRRWFWNGWDNDHCNDVPFTPRKAKQLIQAISLLESQQSMPLLTKSLYLSLSIPALAAAIPRSRFIFITRDPIQVATSLLQTREKLNLKPNQWWSVRPPDYQHQLNNQIEEQVMWQVAETTHLVRDSLENLSDKRWRKITYDDLCTKPSRVISQLEEWLHPLNFIKWPTNELPRQFNMSKSALDHTELTERLRNSPIYPRAKSAIE